MENEIIFQTREGTPQGGVASPVLANLALDGLEGLLKDHFKGAHKIHLVRYSDDFVVTGDSKEVLEDKVKPLVAEFLAERGLSLSVEKTQITHIDQGFDFLGFNVRKYNNKLLIKPSQKGVRRFLHKIREVIKTHKAVKTSELIGMLNPKIIGWCNYYRHVVSKQTFAYVDDSIYRCISRWTVRRHNNKNMDWIRKTYFRKVGKDNWVFFGLREVTNGKQATVTLANASATKIVRHVKIKGEARVFDEKYRYYLWNRRKYGRKSSYRCSRIARSLCFVSNCWLPS